MAIELSETTQVIIIGLFGGAGATLLWEVFFKPKRDRRNVAEVLSAEVSLNLQMLAATLVTAHPKRIPSDFALSLAVFNAVTEKIGELPSRDVGEVIFLYSYFEQLNQLPKTFAQYVDTYRNTAPDSPHRERIEKELQSCIDVFNSYLDKAINRINIVQPRLLRSAFPWWSCRRWTTQRSRQLDLEEVARKAQLSLAHRAQVADEVRKQSGSAGSL